MDKKIMERMFTFLCSIVPVVVVVVFIIYILMQNPSDEYDENTKCIETYFDLEVICEKDVYQICYDRNTNVLYYKISGNNWYDITPILNSDGTPKLYKEE